MVAASIAGSKSVARSRRSRPSEDVGEREAATAGKCRAVEEEKQRPEEKLRSAEDARSKVHAVEEEKLRWRLLGRVLNSSWSLKVRSRQPMGLK